MNSLKFFTLIFILSFFFSCTIDEINDSADIQTFEIEPTNSNDPINVSDDSETDSLGGGSSPPEELTGDDDDGV